MKASLSRMRSSMDFNTVELPGRAEAVMINDLAVADVHSSNASHLFLCQFKIKDVQIFGHPFLVDRLWDGGDIPLEVPAKQNGPQAWGTTP